MSWNPHCNLFIVQVCSSNGVCPNYMCIDLLNWSLCSTCTWKPCFTYCHWLTTVRLKISASLLQPTCLELCKPLFSVARRGCLPYFVQLLRNKLTKFGMCVQIWCNLQLFDVFIRWISPIEVDALTLTNSVKGKLSS